MLALSAGLTFLCRLRGMEERQGPLTAGRGLGVTALLPRQVQLGIGERRFRHGVKYLQVKLHRTVTGCRELGRKQNQYKGGW